MKKRDERGQLFLENTLSRQKQEFQPKNQFRIKLFTCGPSVYKPQHLGNYRTFFYEDILERYLEHLGYDVERVLNYTDIEDKSISQARNEHKQVDQITEPVEQQFTEDCSYLFLRLPHLIPRSSTSVETAVAIIQRLMEKGHAYRHESDIYFDPLTFDGFGKLFGLDMSQWPKEKRRFGKDTYPGQQWNLGDFILWHGYQEGDPVFWNTEIGKGRPSWNVQDPAMIVKHLGTQIDIACGGSDNLYRHHDYTIAVVEAYSGQELAPYWLHGEHLLVDGEKMDKKKGNVVYLANLREKGYSGETIRYYFATQHYRQPFDFSYDGLDAAQKDLAELTGFTKVFTEGISGEEPSEQSSTPALELLSRFEDACNDDLHTDEALKNLNRLLFPLAEAQREGKLSDTDAAGISHVLGRIDSVLQIGL